MKRLIAIAFALALGSAFAAGGLVRGAAARGAMMGGQIVEVEYLESTGTQYIDTGYAFTSENIQLEVSFKSNPNSYVQNLIGSPSVYAQTAYYWGVPNCVGVYFLGSSAKDYWGAGTAGAKNTLSVSSASGSVVVSCEGSSYTYSFSGSLIDGENVMLFAYSTISSRGTTCIYAAKIYDNGVLVRELIPVRLQSGEGYMYDKLESKLYGNAGTGAFVVGPDK